MVFCWRCVSSSCLSLSPNQLPSKTLKMKREWIWFGILKTSYFFTRWWWKHFRWTTQEKNHFNYDKFSEYLICAIEVIASVITWQPYQGIPQQQIACLITFFPWLLCFQKWKCQSESKIRLCFAYWFRSITSHMDLSLWFISGTSHSFRSRSMLHPC